MLFVRNIIKFDTKVVDHVAKSIGGKNLSQMGVKFQIIYCLLVQKNMNGVMES